MTHLPPEMIRSIEELIDASYSGRDELYAAAELLDDDRRSRVCKRLAEHLAKHAIELQQLVTVNGGETLEPLDMYSVAESFFALAKSRRGEAGILDAAEECERVVKERFENVIAETDSDEAATILERQRNDIKFGEDILKAMQAAPKGETS